LPQFAIGTRDDAFALGANLVFARHGVQHVFGLRRGQ
jgi:hypothetical protein